MSRYKNGQIPGNLLVEVGPYHWMTAATAARWRALVADIQKNEGVTMRITPGKNAYRDYEGQVFARNNACAAGRCNDAAVPGTSSHGGEYLGRDSMAIDVDNWAVLGKTKWYSYCRKHGFTPGFFDWEPWHIIDFSPWTMPSGGGTKPAPEKKQEPTLEDLMALKNVTIATENGKNVYDSTTLDFETGMKSTLSKTNAVYTTTVAKYLTGQGSLTITKGHYNNLLREFDAHFKAKREHELAVARAQAGK